jgi:hypothetical protein
MRPDNEPTAVLLEIDEDGRRGEMELIFATRWQAEWFLAQLPLLRIDAVKSAILSPLLPA